MLGVLFFSFLYFITPISWGEEPRLFRIGTGGRTGVYYPIGKLIAQGITPALKGQLKGLGKDGGIQGIIGVAQNSAGSIENVRAVIAGDVEAGLVQADFAAFAFGKK